MNFLRNTIETANLELVLQAVRTVAASRDHREIEIRSMGVSVVLAADGH